MVLDALARQAAERFKQRLDELCPQGILELRVFGSRARGRARPDSDLDVCVLVERRDPQLDRQIVYAACDVYDELDLPFVITPFIASREHFEDLVRRERRIARDILAEGVPL